MEICQTKRLKIRRFVESDSTFILKLLNEESFIKNITDKQVRNNQDAINYLLEGPMATYSAFGFGLYIVTLKKSGIPIGMCGLLKRDTFEYADLGFAFLEDFCSKGYATEASVAILNEENKIHNMDMVVAVTLPSNYSSNNVLKKLGFLLKGTVEVYGKASNLYEYSFDLGVVEL